MNQRRKYVETMLDMLHNKLSAFERELVLAASPTIKFELKQRIDNEIKPQIVRYEAEYQQLLSSDSSTPQPQLSSPQNKTLRDHSDLVKSVAISPLGQMLASGGADKTIKLWDLKTGNLLRTLTGHSSPIMSVKFSPDGMTLATSSNLETGSSNIKLWDVKTGELKTNIGGNLINFRSSCVAFSPDGEILASGNIDATVKLWKLRTGKLETTLKGHGWDVNSVEFSTDGRYLVSGGLDGAIKVWDWRNARLLKTFNRPSPEDFVGSLVSWFDSSVGSINSVAIHPNGNIIASGGSEQPIILWDISSEKITRTFTEHTGSVFSVCFSPNGQLLASGGNDNNVRIWDVTTGELRQTFNHLGPVYCVAFTPDGKTLVSGSGDTTVKIWEIED
ncbi:MAG: WD40 repeat domain-containing protein [Phormidium sp. BM_Day4_Bin.17]|nr:WD40 repeat domain-containing protein [Phormidium sp. BM_Day4_Bin.17]UCJ10628.1 MAG: WD40 repeat domain-containing protein [Phormidium sp. PBR-2020]